MLVGARVIRTADQSIANTTVTPVTWQSIVFDTAGLVDLVAHPTRITLTAGYWLVGACVAWAESAAGTREVSIAVNGVDDPVTLAGTGFPLTAADFPVLTGASVYHFADGDYIELNVWQSSGGPLALSRFAPTTPVLFATFVGW